MKKNCYITTPIYYPSGKFHIGTAYTTLLADALKKYKSYRGFNTHFITGTDEHGQKIQEKAKESNMTPLKYVDNMSQEAIKLWDKLAINYDDFIRTTEDRHKTVVTKIFDKLLQQGDIYLGDYEGNYCMSCESYFTKSQLVDDKCPDCGRETKILKEESYFLNLKKYESKLLKYIEENEDFIQPASRKNEVISFLKQGLNDLSVSRTSFNWGIPVKGNEKHVIYVWIDALSNYLSGLNLYSNDEAMFEKFWKNSEVIQLVGKDILRFHAIYWPIMLMALGIDINFKLYAHGWVLMKDGKMSKSKGNVIYPEVLVDKYSLDAFRYYLLRELPYANDAVFTPEDFVKRVNVDLANDYGNLVNRTANMINKYFDGEIKYNDSEKIFSKELINTMDQTIKEFENNMDSFKLANALDTVMKLVGRTNKYIDETTPWILAKDDTKKEELESVMYNLSESIRNITILLGVVFVEKNKECFNIFNISKISYNDLGYGIQKEYKIEKKFNALFPRLDSKIECEFLSEIMNPKVEEVEEEFITIEDFSKVEIKVGEIIECKSHPKAEKLLVSQVKIGSEIRQIVSGIKSHYKAEEMVGKKVLVVTNLKPIKLRGVLSSGMILAGSKGKNLEVIESTKLPSGSIVK